ncbi:MAG TPA: DNA polymerase [Bacteroidia bacterium]
MIVFDTEDNSSELLAAGKSGFDKTVTQIAAITEAGDSYWSGGDVRDFLAWLDEIGESDVWAFNTPYDIGNLCHRPSGKLKFHNFDLVLVKGRFIRGGYNGFNFFDVHNLSGNGSSIGTLGFAVGLPKFGFPYKPNELKSFPLLEQKKYQKFAKMSDAERFRNKEYVLRDCQIPMEWLKFIRARCDEFGIDKIPSTLGGLCVKAFAALGYANWFEASDNSHAACYGGRVELFSCGGSGHIMYVDVNSLYPHAMTMDFPECYEDLEKSLDGYGVAKCQVSVPKDLQLAPLPYHDDESRMIFPVGTFSGIWTLAELRAATKFGVKIKKVFWSYGSKTAQRYYADYIKEMYRRRLASKSPAEKLFWKLLMNNLYGRLAIGGEVSRSMRLTDKNNREGVPYGDKILCDYKMPLPEFTNYLHAAHVLAYARITLLDYMARIPAENLIYCDTDSIIFFWKPDKPLPFPITNDLGALKLESVGSRCDVYLPKTYHFKGEKEEWKAKGVPRRHAREFIINGEAEFDLPFKMREAIRFYDKDNSRKLSVWRRVNKMLKAEYDRKRKSGKFYLPKVLNLS